MQTDTLSTFRILIALAVFYLIFALFYMFSLSLSAGGLEWLSWGIVYLDYPLKAIMTVPIWWLVFRKMADRSIFLRIGITLLLLPLWVKGWQTIYYYYLDNFTGTFHLEGAGEWWDIYIPALFYCIQFGVFFTVENYQNFKRTVRAKAESEKLVLAGELSALKAQLNPHFLYNAFNTISASVPPGEEKTRELIGHLSDMFRFQLKASKLNSISLREEIKFIEDYLTMEKARFGERLRVELSIPADLAGAAVPPLILQPLVENAVKHGIAPLVEGGRVTITAIAIDKENLQLTVADNGAGFENTGTSLQQGNGVGLANIRRRLELIFGTELIIQRPPEGGTRIHFTIPLTYVIQDRTDRRRSPRPQTLEGVPG